MEQIMELNPLLVTLITSLFIPIVVGIVVKANASTAIKNVVMIVTTGVVTLINANVTDTGSAVLSTETLTYWAISIVATIAAYLGLYKPVEANDKLLPNFGVGKPND